MFFNLYCRRVKVFAFSMDTVIWVYVVPLVLSTMFWLCFQNIDTVNNINTISVAVVNDAAWQSDEALQSAMAAASIDDVPLFDIHLTGSAEEAAALLDAGSVSGIITAGEPVSLTVADSGVNESVIKSFLDRYEQIKARVASMISQNPAAAADIESLISNEAFTAEQPLTSAEPSPRASYYYALIAMICLYGSFVGMNCATMLQANLSPMGARRVVSPVPRMKLVLCDMLAALTVHFTAILVLLAYVTLVQGIKFGDRIPAMIATCALGSIVGITLGSAVGCAMTKAKAGVKGAVLAVVSMAGCFLAGLMVGGMNYMVAKSAPIVAAINPAGRVADAFYSLYYYDTYTRYWGDMMAMGIMAVIFIAVTVIFVRRQRYASI